MRRFFFPLLVSAAFLYNAGFLYPRENISSGEEIVWYFSNAAGMAIEPVSSRFAALRAEYCLSVERAERGALPAILSPYYEYSFTVELRTLYENGKEFRSQWIFRDGRNTTRLVASGTVSFFSEEVYEGESRSGFIEIMDADGLVTSELRFEEDGSERKFVFSYNASVLVDAETWFREAPPPLPEISAGAENEAAPSAPAPDFVLLTRDRYRYTRSGSLRAIDRLVVGAANGTAGLSRTSFPHLSPVFPTGEEFITSGIAYNSEFLLNISIPEGAMASFSLDSRGRVLSELWKSGEGETLGEFVNTWSGDKLVSVLWKSPGDERLVEYEYDASGNRISEKNFREGILERTVLSQDDRDIETIFMNGRPILRVIWEGGVKISEERISREAQTR